MMKEKETIAEFVMIYFIKKVKTGKKFVEKKVTEKIFFCNVAS